MKHPITGLDQSPLVCPHHHVASSNNNGQCLQCDKQRLNTSGFHFLVSGRIYFQIQTNFSVSIPGQHSKTNTMIRVSNFFQVDAITIRKEDLKAQEFPLAVNFSIFIHLFFFATKVFFPSDFFGIDSAEKSTSR